MASSDMTLEARMQEASKTKPPNAEDRLARLYERECHVIGSGKSDHVVKQYEFVKRCMTKR